jgi:putative PIN family toxin of toxin-antitoxin system
MVISAALLDELRRVLRYPKLRFGEDDIALFEADILNHAQVVQPTRAIRVVSDDPDDDRVLECAAAAGASYIVSGDRHLLALHSYEGTTIVTARVAIAVLGRA